MIPSAPHIQIEVLREDDSKLAGERWTFRLINTVHLVLDLYEVVERQSTRAKYKPVRQFKRGQKRFQFSEKIAQCEASLPDDVKAEAKAKLLEFFANEIKTGLF